VLADSAAVGRIFKAHAAPMGMPWMWTMLFDYRTPTHGYEPTREAAMAAFAKGGGSERRGQTGWRLDSERIVPFVDIAQLFAER
jgi:hypothetical protein